MTTESFDFEVFDPTVYRRQRARHISSPSVSLVVNGRNRDILINPAAMAAMGDPSSVVLLWSASERAIGLRPARDDDPNAYRVRPNNGRPGRVSATGYCRRFGLLERPSQRLSASWGDGILVAKLDEGTAFTEGSKRPLSDAPVAG